jgi:hypothetical protein
MYFFLAPSEKAYSILKKHSSEIVLNFLYLIKFTYNIFNIYDSK